jgi:hypothetical protein
MLDKASRLAGVEYARHDGKSIARDLRGERTF